MQAELINSNFTLSDVQKEQIEKLFPLYQEWNAKINVISRKDVDSLYLHHVLHSLGILKFYDFVPGSEVLDLGTGGGFPGIPLAILRPDAQFHLIDGTAKKLKVVQSVVDSIGLQNVKVRHIRAEEYRHRFDMVVTRAVADASKLLNWGRPLLKRKHLNAYPNGIIALKGGAVREELKALPRHEYFEIHSLSGVFPDPYFGEKYVVYIQG
jgi:16S rRNA (guanine527-N7)-methyltransferase